MRVSKAHNHPVCNMQHMNEVYTPLIAPTCLTVAMTWIASLHNASCRNIACPKFVYASLAGFLQGFISRTCAAAVRMA